MSVSRCCCHFFSAKICLTCVFWCANGCSGRSISSPTMQSVREAQGYSLADGAAWWYVWMVPSKSFQERNVTQLAVTPLGPNTCCCQWPWLPYKTPNLGVTPGGYIQSSHTSRLWSHGVSDVWQPAAFWQMLIFWSGNPPEYWLPSKPMEATTNCDYDILVARSRMPKEFLRHWQFERHPNATKFVHLPNKAGTFATTIVKLGHL